MTWTLPRESVEMIGPITVTDGGTPVTGFEVALIGRTSRPVGTDWQAPTLVGGAPYVLVGPGTPLALGPGSYRLWVRYSATPETPVIDDVGTVVIT